MFVIGLYFLSESIDPESKSEIIIIVVVVIDDVVFADSSLIISKIHVKGFNEFMPSYLASSLPNSKGI